MGPLASLLVDTFVSLVAVAALAVLVLYGVRRAGFGRPSGPLALVGRLPLDGRRAIYLVRVAETVYVLGASEAGLVKLGEIEGTELSGAFTAPTSTPFARVLSRVIERREKPGAGDGQR